MYSFSFSAIDRVWLNLYERALSGNEQIPFETFVREFIQCYTESVMLGPRFIPESVFYTQSVMLSPRFIPECVFCFVLFSTFPAMQYQICFFHTFSHLRNLKVQRRVTIPQGQQHVSSFQQS